MRLCEFCTNIIVRRASLSVLGGLRGPRKKKNKNFQSRELKFNFNFKELV